VGPAAYCLKLPYAMKKHHPMFNVMKLSAALIDLIPGQKPNPPPLPIIVDEEKE